MPKSLRVFFWHESSVAGADPFLLLLTTLPTKLLARVASHGVMVLALGIGRTRMRQGKVGYEK